MNKEENVLKILEKLFLWKNHSTNHVFYNLYKAEYPRSLVCTKRQM